MQYIHAYGWLATNVLYSGIALVYEYTHNGLAVYEPIDYDVTPNIVRPFEYKADRCCCESCRLHQLEPKPRRLNCGHALLQYVVGCTHRGLACLAMQRAVLWRAPTH